jgi:hypothetical protein
VLRDYRVQPGDSLGKLEDTFRSQALDPSSFSWRMIARASFNGKDKPRDVNRFLKHTKFVDKDGKLRPYGVLSGDGLNYKFTVGAPLKIPVRWDPPAMDPTDKDRAWYRAVMKDWEVIQGKERTKNGKKPSGESVCKVEPDLSFVPHVLINIKLDEVKELIDRANAMRNDACEAYMPSQKKDEKDAARKAKASPLPLRHTLERGELLTGKARRESGDEVYVCTHYAEQVLELANYEVTAEVSDAIHMPMPDEQIAPAVEAGQDRMRGVARAIAEFGLGRYVQTSELQPGDFVQYWTTRGDGVEGHCGQVMRVGPGPTTVQLHGCHRSTGLVSTIEVDLKKDVLQVYAARPKGNE